MDNDTREAHELREAYLSRVSRRLDEGLGPLEVYETVEEFRRHLQEIALEGEQTGLGPVESMHEAIERFGAGEKIASGIKGTTGRPNLKAYALAIGSSAVATIGLGLLCMEILLLAFAGTSGLRTFQVQAGFVHTNIVYALLICPPAAVLRGWRPYGFALAALAIGFLLGCANLISLIGRPSFNISYQLLYAAIQGAFVFALALVASVVARRMLKVSWVRYQ